MDQLEERILQTDQLKNASKRLQHRVDLYRILLYLFSLKNFLFSILLFQITLHIILLKEYLNQKLLSILREKSLLLNHEKSRELIFNQSLDFP